MSSFPDQHEIVTQDPGQGGGIVSNDRQPAAALRAVGSESRDDDVTTRAHGPLQAGDVGIAVRRIGQEMKGGSIVPKVIDAQGLARR